MTRFIAYRLFCDAAGEPPQGRFVEMAIDDLSAGELVIRVAYSSINLHWMEHNGLTPDAGKVLVTGATGGVGSIATDMLAQRGYAVTALTGKNSAHDYLHSLGAAEILPAEAVKPSGRPLEKALWAGAIDSVGGSLLAWLLRTVQPDGVVACFGNVGGADFDATVLPFILRGVKLVGINANSPMALRETVWRKIAGEYRPRRLRTIANLIDLDKLPHAMDQMRGRATRGRTVIRMQP